MKITLKNFKLETRLIQSPMAGCTDLAFRLLSRQYGMEFAFLEMVAADSLVRQNKKTLSLLKTAPEDKPLGAQLVGCNPDTMAEAAVIIEDMGFDLLDLNLGCPVPKIVSPGGGSALLIQPDKAGLIFKKITKSVKRIPVTVKMRKGFEDQSGKEALHISRLAEDSGMTAVTVHGRTRAQGYTGKADWEAIGMIKRNLKIPVFGNGDVLSGEDAKRLMEVSGCDGVMIGRGGLGNPWVYNEIDAAINGVKSRLDDITLEDKRQALLKHLELEIKTEGEKLALLKMRRIACWYFKNLPGASEFRNQINRTETTDQVREFILNFNPTSSSAGTDH